MDILFPPKCVGCSKEGDFLCSVCERSLARLEDPYCPTCAQPMRSEATCQRCQESPLDIDGIRSPFLMEGVIRIMIHRMKYNDFRALATVLGRLLSSSMDAYLIPADFLMAVPLHPRRERRRGYNQSLLLAREVSMSKGIPLAKGLVRVKDAPPQARAADAESRRANVKDAFAFRGTGLDGRRVLLIDDVCTTGATLGACALALKNSGAAAVWGLTLAREA
ncbi:MAG: ComF family protein [Chloroflexi bacterium]|nr:ComF family protein [Chloroflexota bacterium]